MPRVVPLATRLHKVFTVFVNGVVGEVHEQVTKIATHRWSILLRTKAGQSLLVNEDPQRNYRRDQHVYSQIKLQVVDQERLVQVALGYVVLARLEPVIATGQKDALSLTAGLRLDDKGLCLFVVKLILECFEVCG